MPTWKRQLCSAANRIRPDPRWQLIDQTQILRRTGATLALVQLGAKAEREIANLSSIANDPKRFGSRLSAVMALQAMGGDALPAIVGVLTNEQNRTTKWSDIRIACAVNISRLAVDDPKTAQLAQPALRSMCEDPDGKTRRMATNALRVIDPKWLERLRSAGHY